MISRGMPLAPLTTTPAKGTGPGNALIDKTGRFNRLQPSFRKQLKELAKDFYNKYETPLILTDTLRTKAEQAQVHQKKPNLALPADHPNAMHPRGLAVDVDTNQAEKITPKMLAENGLHLPALSKGETWHIEPKSTSSGGTYATSRKARFQANPVFSKRTTNLRQLTQLSEPLSLLSQEGLTEGGATGDGRRLQAAVEVEAIFLGQLLEQMRRSMVDPLSQDSKQLRGYISMADQHLARALAAGGGLGLAAKILDDLAPTESHSQKEDPHEGNSPVPERLDDPGGDLPLSRTS